MIFFTFLLSATIAVASGVRPEGFLPAPDFESELEDGEYLRADLNCLAEPPQKTGLGRINTREELLATARSHNLLGALVANPFCFLANRNSSQVDIKTFVRIMEQNCQTPRALQRPACQMIADYYHYTATVAEINKGKQVTRLLVPDNWQSIDLRAGSFRVISRAEAALEANKADPTPLVVKTIFLEAAIQRGLEDAVRFLQTATARSGAEMAAGRAMARIHSPYIGLQLRRLFAHWQCPTLNVPGACALRKDLIVLLLRSALSDLKEPLDDALSRVERVSSTLNSSQSTKVGNTEFENSNGGKRFKIILALEEFTTALQSGDDSKNSQALQDVVKNYSQEFLIDEFEDPSRDVMPYRAVVNLMNLRAIRKVLEEPLSDEELALAQYNLWKRAYVVNQLRNEIKKQVQLNINLVKNVFERGD